ncbi:PREDICTED: uncharacterized protein LOC107067608 [Polistes dominula]|uniref:Uncharacterized protein LOC107067608 n=1 Tax=Polistes dominula TaxID=743375 RepID=A0ABM1IEV9_POLDO|nr:PREDICTED: uncharacterized protein LOC107067608 [Polistes dominula]
MPLKRDRKVRWKKAMTKEEKQKVALERQLMLKREHLNREIKMGALNTMKYRQLWRELMMRAKMPIIKENIEIAWRTFDRIIDNKDHRYIFFVDTKNRRKIYEIVKDKNEKNQQIITNQYVRISVLSEIINKFRDKVATHKANVNKDFKEIMDEQHFFYSSYWIMKNRLISGKRIFVHIINNFFWYLF